MPGDFTCEDISVVMVIGYINDCAFYEGFFFWLYQLSEVEFDIFVTENKKERRSGFLRS